MTRRARLPKILTRFGALVRQPIFWVLTVSGNTVVILGALALYHFESAAKTDMPFLDCVLWSMGIVTTVGYGNFVAESIGAKLTVLVLMASGTLFVWSYMAFLVTGLIAPELATLERDVHEVEKELRDLREKAEKTLA